MNDQERFIACVAGWVGLDHPPVAAIVHVASLIQEGRKVDAEAWGEITPYDVAEYQVAQRAAHLAGTFAVRSEFVVPAFRDTMGVL